MKRVRVWLNSIVPETGYFYRPLRFTARLFYRFSVFEQTHCKALRTFGKKSLIVSSTILFNHTQTLHTRSCSHVLV